MSANQCKHKKQIMPKLTDQEIFEELKTRWKTPIDRLTASQQKPQQMNNHPAWYVTCPKCQKVGSRMGIGDKGGYVLLCPNCKCYPLGQLIKEFAQDIYFAVTRATTDRPYEKPTKTKTSHPHRPRRSAEEREELKKQAREIRRGLMISPRESSNPF